MSHPVPEPEHSQVPYPTTYDPAHTQGSGSAQGSGNAQGSGTTARDTAVAQGPGTIRDQPLTHSPATSEPGVSHLVLPPPVATIHNPDNAQGSGTATRDTAVTQGPSTTQDAFATSELGNSRPISIRQPARPPRQRSPSPFRPPFDSLEALSGRGPATGLPLPPLPPEARAVNNGGEGQPLSPGRRKSGIDWIVPVDEKAARERTVGERLQPTLLTAISEKDKYAFKAKITGYTLNIAIGLQVLLGALTTGLSASSQSPVATTILGALSTLVASYLARARGSNEPELSITRVKDLDQFIRECEAFQMDNGHQVGTKFDSTLETLRRRFEELLGNANGERRLAPPV